MKNDADNEFNNKANNEEGGRPNHLANESDMEQQTELTEPVLFHVVLHNDDFTPMEFVVGLLEEHFYMSREQAAEKTLEAHVKGKSACGTFSKDFAEAKLAQVMEYVRLHHHPLRCSMEAAG